MNWNFLLSLTYASVVCVALTTTVSLSVKYSMQENSYYTGSDVTAEVAAISLRHCSQLCTRRKVQGGCAAANYNRSGSRCQLFASFPANYVMSAAGLVAIREITFDPDGMMGLWPLNQQHQGANLVSGKSNIELFQVTYTDANNDAANAWSSAPVRFDGSTSSYGKLTNVEDVRMVSGDFAFITSVYREVDNNLPMMEYYTGSSYATYFWIHQNKFLVNIQYASCVRNFKYSADALGINQWYTLAASYDNINKVLSMWVNGQLETETFAACSSDYLAAQFVYLNHRPGWGAVASAQLTCMALWDKQMTYTDMVDNTRPNC